MTNLILDSFEDIIEVNNFNDESDNIDKNTFYNDK